MKANPFDQNMVRLQLPADCGTQVSAGGFTVDADEDRCVSVPKGPIADALMSHGLTPATTAAAADAKKK